jgi:hypothetical protein
MIVLDSGSDDSREWFLVGAAESGRLFLVVRSGARESVRWVMPNARWSQFEPASAVEADAVRRCVEGTRAEGALAWDDVRTTAATWRTFRARSTPSN